MTLGAENHTEGLPDFFNVPRDTLPSRESWEKELAVREMLVWIVVSKENWLWATYNYPVCSSSLQVVLRNNISPRGLTFGVLRWLLWPAEGKWTHRSWMERRPAWRSWRWTQLVGNSCVLHKRQTDCPWDCGLKFPKASDEESSSFSILELSPHGFFFTLFFFSLWSASCSASSFSSPSYVCYLFSLFTGLCLRSRQPTLPLPFPVATTGLFFTSMVVAYTRGPPGAGGK